MVLLLHTVVLPTLEMGVYAAFFGGQPQQGDRRYPSADLLQAGHLGICVASK